MHLTRSHRYAPSHTWKRNPPGGAWADYILRHNVARRCGRTTGLCNELHTVQAAQRCSTVRIGEKLRRWKSWNATERAALSCPVVRVNLPCASSRVHTRSKPATAPAYRRFIKSCPLQRFFSPSNITYQRRNTPPPPSSRAYATSRVERNSNEG